MNRKEKKALDETVKIWKKARKNPLSRVKTGISDKISLRLNDGEIKDFFQGLEDNVENIFQATGAFDDDVPQKDSDKRKDKLENLKKAIEILEQDKIKLETGQHPKGIPSEIIKEWLESCGICFMINVGENIRASHMTDKEILDEIAEKLRNAKNLVLAIKALKGLSFKLHGKKIASFFQKLENDIKNMRKASDALENAFPAELVNYKTEVKNFKKALKTLKQDKVKLKKGEYPKGISKEIAEAYFHKVDMIICILEPTLKDAGK